jgi:hypothetical protein
MRRLFVIFLLCFSCGVAKSPPSHVAAMDDVEVMLRRPDGMYKVKCRNGSTELDSSEQVRNGDVCNGSSQTNRYPVRCEGAGSSVQLVRSNDGFTFPGFMDPADCRRVVQATRLDVTCISSATDTWWITRLSDGERIGTRTSLDQCLLSSGSNRQGITCATNGLGWQVVRVVDAHTFGANSLVDECTQALQANREGVVCTQRTIGHWAPTRINDGQMLGLAGDFSDCVDATDEAYSGKVCTMTRPGRWHLTNILDGISLGASVALDACVTQ